MEHKENKKDVYEFDIDILKRFQTDTNDYKWFWTGYKWLITGTVSEAGVSLTEN